MFGSAVLEIGIGMALLFLFISLICTAVREGAEAFLKSRAKDLERGIREILNDRDGNGIVQSFYNHPLIFSLFSGEYDWTKLKGEGAKRYIPLQDRQNLPSYIPALNFAGALLDMAARGKDAGAAVAAEDERPTTVQSLRETVGKLENEKLQRVVLAALDGAEGDLARVKANLVTWYDGTMDRVSGVYKRRTQKILFCLGLGLAAILNVDAITVAQRLGEDKPLRDAVVGQAANLVREVGGNIDALQAEGYRQVRARLDAIGYPIGWVNGNPSRFAAPQFCKISPKNTLATGAAALGANPGNAADADLDIQCNRESPLVFVQMLLGWLITAFAITLGAPFWFDLLNKFMVVRSTVKPYEKSGPEGSEDRRPAARTPAAAPAPPAVIPGTAAGANVKP